MDNFVYATKVPETSNNRKSKNKGNTSKVMILKGLQRVMLRLNMYCKLNNDTQDGKLTDGEIEFHNIDNRYARLKRQ